jgi:hypothetical protein
MAETSIEFAKNVIINYKDITSWILLGIILIFAFINYKKEAALAKEIEKIKSELSKKEIKFTRHTEMQIECLKTMYEMLVSYHYELTKLLYPKEANIDSFKKSIETSRNTFYELIMFCQRNRILLTDSIVIQFRLVHNKFNEHKKFIEIEEKAISNLEDLNQTKDPNYLYGTAEIEGQHVINHLKSISDKFNTTEYEDEVQNLREIIENYFKNLVE